MPHQTKTYQLDLFSNPGEAEATPPWQALPAQTRRRLTKLMVRLILDHIDGERAVQREGADHDA